MNSSKTGWILAAGFAASIALAAGISLNLNASLIGLAVVLVGALLLFHPALYIEAILVFAPFIWAFGSAGDASLNQLRGTGGPIDSDVGVNVAAIIGSITTLRFLPHLFFRQKDAGLEPLRYLALIYFASLLPSALLAENLKTGLGVFARQISPFTLLFGALYYFQDEKAVKRLLRAAALSVASMALVVGAAFVRDEYLITFGHLTRLRAFSITPQAMAFFTATLIAVLTISMYVFRTFLLPCAGLLFLAISLYATGFRTAWLGAFAFALALIFTVRTHIAIKAAAAVAILLLFGYGDGIAKAIKRYGGETEVSMDALDTISSGRLSVIELAIDNYKSASLLHKLVGTGLYSTSQVTENSYLGMVFYIHNDFLATFIESGPISFLAYVAAFCALVKALWDARRTTQSDIVRAVAGCGMAFFIAATLMAFAGAWYTNVFCGWYAFALYAVALAYRSIDRVAARASETEQVGTANSLDGVPVWQPL